MAKVILGTGSGRCGTTSLAYLFNKQDQTIVSHSCPYTRKQECFSANRLLMPDVPLDKWNPKDHLSNLFNRDKYFSVDCSCTWISVLEIVWFLYPEIKVVCLQRDKTSTIESFMNLNHPYIHDEEQISHYYDIVYSLANDWSQKRPEFFLLAPTSSLDSESGRQRLLEFAELPAPGSVLALEPIPRLNCSTPDSEEKILG